MLALTQSEAIDVLQVLGVEIAHVSGSEVWALCPMHKDRTGKEDRKPSWSLNHDQGTHHCFSCGYTGHIVGLVADLRDTDFGRAGRWLRKIGVSMEAVEAMPTWAERSSGPGGPLAHDARELEDVLRGFGPPPEAAMVKRRVTAEAVAHYGVLWDPKNRGWVLPVRLPDGELVGYQFKRKSVVLNKPTSMKKSVTLFGIDTFRSEKAIVVESPLDCLYLHSLGIQGAVSSFGAHVSDAQMRMLVERADAIVLALDNDAAGKGETRRLITGISWIKRKPVKGIVWPRRIPIWVFDYGEATGKDPGEMERHEVFRGLRDAKHDLEMTWAENSPPARGVFKAPPGALNGQASPRARGGFTGPGGPLKTTPLGRGGSS